MKILYFLIFFLLGAISKEGSLKKDTDNFNVKVDKIIQSNGLFAVKKLRDFAKIFAVTGNTYGDVISAGLEVGISELHADTAAAAVSAYNNTLAKLNLIQTTVSRLQDELPLEAFDFNYGAIISKPMLHLFSVIRHSFAATLPHQGFEILERGCLKHDPYLVLESMFFHTKCTPFNHDAFENYEKAFKIVRNAESKMDLRYIEATEIEKYNELKEYFYLMVMHNADFDPIFRNLTRDIGQDVIDFRSFYSALLKVKMFSDYELSNECWAKIVYNGVKHSRVKLQKFVDIIKLDCARAMISTAVCGNVTHFHNPESLNAMFNNSVNYAKDISKQLTDFVNDITKLAYPCVMKTAVNRDIGSNPLEVSMLNKFSTKIRKSLNDRDLEEYEYHVFVTTLTKDNVEYKYKCRINGDCFDIVINNVRIFVIRYLPGNNVTKAIYESDEFWNKTSNDWDFLLKTTEPAYYLNALAKVFFVPDLISRWSVLIFHVNGLQAREGSATARVGFDFSKYQGLAVYKNLTRFDQHYFWKGFLFRKRHSASIMRMKEVEAVVQAINKNMKLGFYINK